MYMGTGATVTRGEQGRLTTVAFVRLIGTVGPPVTNPIFLQAVACATLKEPGLTTRPRARWRSPHTGG